MQNTNRFFKAIHSDLNARKSDYNLISNLTRANSDMQTTNSVGEKSKKALARQQKKKQQQATLIE